jgi:hypothetical protein
MLNRIYQHDRKNSILQCREIIYRYCIMARRFLRRKRTRNKRRSNMKTRRSVHGGRRSRRRGQRRRQRRRTLRGGGWFTKSKEAQERDARLKADADSHKPSQGLANIAKLRAHDANVKAAGGHTELAKQKVEAERREAYGTAKQPAAFVSKHGKHAVHVDWKVDTPEGEAHAKASREAAEMAQHQPKVTHHVTRADDPNA